MAITTKKLVVAWYFMVCCAIFDTIITVIGVLHGGGKEGNPLINWIPDESLMLLCMVAITIALVLVSSFLVVPRMKVLMNYPKYAVMTYFLFFITAAWRLSGGISWLLLPG